jgi:small basic protein
VPDSIPSKTITAIEIAAIRRTIDFLRSILQTLLDTDIFVAIFLGRVIVDPEATVCVVGFAICRSSKVAPIHVLGESAVYEGMITALDAAGRNSVLLACQHSPARSRQPHRSGKHSAIAHPTTCQRHQRMAGARQLLHQRCREESVM